MKVQGGAPTIVIYKLEVYNQCHPGGRHQLPVVVGSKIFVFQLVFPGHKSISYNIPASSKGCCLNPKALRDGV